MHKNNSHTFLIDKGFFLDGSPFKFISGALHYFRVVPQYWQDRLEKLKAMGCNTVETYIPWNFHEPRKGEFCFHGMADLQRFILLAQKLGLWVIVRPGPYICAEWEFGGLPAWLLAEDGMRVRSRHPSFLKHLQEYFDVLLPKLIPLQADQGGPILLFQVENEYGYYGDDSKYMEAVRDMLVRGGLTMPLITSDGAFAESLGNGLVTGALPTANFGSDPQEKLSLLRKHLPNPEGPLMVTEFWIGWFDAWGSGKHRDTPSKQSVGVLDYILQNGHVNFYMFHGGTNFGFMNGANYYDKLEPDVTSYDYGAPLSEDGRITEKYQDFRNVIAGYADVPPVEFSQRISYAGFGFHPVVQKVSLFSTLAELAPGIAKETPLCMEKLGQSYGYVVYEAQMNKDLRLERIAFTKTNDRACVYAGLQHLVTLYDKELVGEHPLNAQLPAGCTVRVLVENMGRVNFGYLMDQQRKGIDGNVWFNGFAHTGWKHYCLSLDPQQLQRINFGGEYHSGTPGFYHVPFEVDTPADTFLDMSGWGKGCVFLNGFALGRFWEQGPQWKLYVPAPLLQAGHNQLCIFETEGRAADGVTFSNKPGLSPLS